MKTRLLLFLVLLIAFAVPSPARADGIIIPDPPICIDMPCPPLPCPGPFQCPPVSPMVQLVIRYHHVTVTIEDQVAITHVDQVFYNPNDWQVEGTYLFPIPLEAAVTAFTLWVDGEPVEGKVLPAKQARQTYEDIVRSLNDPALLEYVGRGAMQANIFPIPPQGERRIELEYTQVLPAENSLVHYVYPLNTEKFSAWPLENVSVNVNIHTTGVPIRAVYSPSHELDVSRASDTQVSAGYEATNVRPDSDFDLYYSLGEEQAFHLLTYRNPDDPSDADGFFLLLLAPRPDAATQASAKDLILVLDRSGSMEGEKFQQAQAALRYVLGHLNPEDRFNLISFSTGLETYASGLRPADEASEAMAWVDRLSAQGSTDINRALLEAAAIADRERPTYLIFLTDGLPTVGVIESQEILSNFEAAAPDELRIFPFGVGYDVDTFLLDSLAQAHHGASTYVRPGERLDEVLSGFYARISTPVLTNLELDFGDVAVYDLYPEPLPDLFAGSQIVVAGRYRRGATATVTLRGLLNGQEQTFRFPEQVFAESSLDESATLGAIPRLWATRKIGALLNQVRLQGANQELIDQIVRLSIRYGIVTPYTSYLVTEEAPLGAAEQDRIIIEEFNAMRAAPAAPAYGQGAVDKAAEMGGMEGAGAASSPSVEVVDTVRVVGSRAYVNSKGVWTDTAFDPDRMQTVRVAFLSDDYFELAAAYPEIGAAFALGTRVIAFAGGVAYEVVEEGTVTQPIDIPDTPAPDQPVPAGADPTQPTDPVSTSVPETDSTPSQPAPGTLPCASPLLGMLPLAWLIIGRKRGTPRS